jgi:hypothetical protein
LWSVTEDQLVVQTTEQGGNWDGKQSVAIIYSQWG